MTNQEIVDKILLAEGWPKYTDRAADKGGPTKGGITLGTLRGWRKNPGLGVDSLKALREEEAREIYENEFITKPGYDGIKDAVLRDHVVDCAVNHGVSRVSRWVQEIAKKFGTYAAGVDGDVGPKTLKAVNAMDPGDFNLFLAVWRIRFIGQVINENAKARRDGRLAQSTDQGLNAEGWLNRYTEILLTEVPLMRRENQSAS